MAQKNSDYRLTLPLELCVNSFAALTRANLSKRSVVSCACPHTKKPLHNRHIPAAVPVAAVGAATVTNSIFPLRSATSLRSGGIFKHSNCITGGRTAETVDVNATADTAQAEFAHPHFTYISIESSLNNLCVIIFTPLNRLF